MRGTLLCLSVTYVIVHLHRFLPFVGCNYTGIDCHFSLLKKKAFYFIPSARPGASHLFIYLFSCQENICLLDHDMLEKNIFYYSFVPVSHMIKCHTNIYSTSKDINLYLGLNRQSCPFQALSTLSANMVKQNVINRQEGSFLKVLKCPQLNLLLSNHCCITAYT